jgi:HTH-type transcriptional regulator/antitoxin HigA
MNALRNDAELQRALARMSELWGAASDTPEAAELEALSDLISEYEARFAIPAADPREVIRFKLAELGWKQNELARRSGLSSGRVSELLSGRRELTMESVRAIAGALGVPVGVLMGGVEPGHDVVLTERSRARLVALAAAMSSRFDAVFEYALTSGLDVLEARHPVPTTVCARAGETLRCREPGRAGIAAPRLLEAA